MILVSKPGTANREKGPWMRFMENRTFREIDPTRIRFMETEKDLVEFRTTREEDLFDVTAPT